MDKNKSFGHCEIFFPTTSKRQWAGFRRCSDQGRNNALFHFNLCISDDIDTLGQCHAVGAAHDFVENGAT